MEFIKNIFDAYPEFKNENLSGRYLPYSKISPGLKKLPEEFRVEILGYSVLGKEIPAIQFGTGEKRILGWSQMHGNESTTTKAVFDLLALFKKRSIFPEAAKIFSACNIIIIPMLNPDGAFQYTRENANGIDLNRDADNLSQPESVILRKIFDDFDPQFCFNLHDQRSIFGAGVLGKPAGISFLAPAMDESRSFPESRMRARQLISCMYKDLSGLIPEQIGRFDDAFNLNCTGDRFQVLEVPTVLFEAGHFEGDYLREISRKYMALAIFSGFRHLANEQLTACGDNYFSIPENKKNFYDILIKNAVVEGQKIDIAIQFREQLVSGEIHFIPVVEKMGEITDFFAHREIDAKNQEISNVNKDAIQLEDELNKFLLKNRTVKLKI